MGRERADTANDPNHNDGLVLLVTTINERERRRRHGFDDAITECYRQWSGVLCGKKERPKTVGLGEAQCVQNVNAADLGALPSKAHQ